MMRITAVLVLIHSVLWVFSGDVNAEAENETVAPISPESQVEADFAAWYLGAEDDAVELSEHILLSEGPQPSPGPHLREDQVEQLIEILNIVRPDAAKRVIEIREQAGERAGAIIAREHPRVFRFLNLRERDPQLFELRMADFQLNRESLKLATAYREASMTGNTEESSEIRASLLQVVREHFELREDIREHELELLETRLDQLRDELEARRDNADQIIRERTAELTGELSEQW